MTKDWTKQQDAIRLGEKPSSYKAILGQTILRLFRDP